MITPLSSAGIMLSYTCNSKCRHCLYYCGPEWRGWADIGLVRAIFEGTLKVARTIHGFHLAGGEAFLNFPLLLESMKLATHYGIPIDYVETNAGWFTDEESAIEKLTQLREAGLACLLVSASPFHAEHIPIEKTLCTTGVRGLLEFATTQYGFTPRQTYAGKCDLCVDIRRHLVTSGAEFAELKPREFYGEWRAPMQNDE